MDCFFCTISSQFPQMDTLNNKSYDRLIELSPEFDVKGGAFVLICVLGVQREDDFEWLAQLRYYIEVCYSRIIVLMPTNV